MIENPRAMEESFKQYLSTMKAGMDKAGLPMPNEALEALHRSADEGALLAFNSRKIGDTVDNYIKELKVSSLTHCFSHSLVLIPKIGEDICRVSEVPKPQSREGSASV